MTVFRPERTHFLAIGLMTLLALMVMSWAPLRLSWLLLAPALFAWWVLRARTTVTERGIDIAYAFRKGKQVNWEDFAGIGFRGAGAYARTNQGIELSLPGISFNSLPLLAEASRGRIPDALTAAQNAADGKVRVIHRDGHEVLLTQEEYEEYRRNNAGDTTS